MADFVEVLGLRASVRIGVGERERRRRQEVILDLRLHANVRRAGKYDALDETVDYERVARRVVETVERQECRLIERLAESVARLCVREFGIRRVRVRVEKPKALKSARAAVTIERTAADYPR